MSLFSCISDIFSNNSNEYVNEVYNDNTKWIFMFNFKSGQKMYIDSNNIEIKKETTFILSFNTKIVDEKKGNKSIQRVDLYIDTLKVIFHDIKIIRLKDNIITSFKKQSNSSISMNSPLLKCAEFILNNLAENTHE